MAFSAKSGFGRWMKAVGLAAGLACPAAAHAQTHVAPGVLIGFATGSEASFTLGLDVVGYPSVGQTTAFGLFGRLQSYDFEALRFAGGVVGAAYNRDFLGAGELGWAYLMSRDDVGSVQGIHMGGEADSFLFGINVYGILPLLGDEAASDFGVAFTIRPTNLVDPPRFGTTVEGRPLRAGSGRMVPAIARAPRTDDGDLGIDARTRARLAEKWTEAARSEHASVPAFVRLARELRDAGAPRGLVAAAIEAAREEVEHARDAFSLASRYAGEILVPGALPAAARAASTRGEALERLAVESLVDGGLGEGAAAAEAEAALDEVTDESVRATLARVAIEEARHADLGWRVLEWAMDEGGRRVEDAVAREIERADPGAPAVDVDADVRELSMHGVPSASTRTRAKERTWAGWRKRAAERLG